MHYIDEGQGAVILFIHGTPSWSFDYRNTTVALPSITSVLVYQINQRIITIPQSTIVNPLKNSSSKRIYKTLLYLFMILEGPSD